VARHNAGIAYIITHRLKVSASDRITSQRYLAVMLGDEVKVTHYFTEVTFAVLLRVMKYLQKQVLLLVTK